MNFKRGDWVLVYGENDGSNYKIEHIYNAISGNQMAVLRPLNKPNGATKAVSVEDLIRAR